MTASEKGMCMTLDRKKHVTLIGGILCGMLICAFFSMRHGPHRAAFGLAFDSLLLFNFWLGYRADLNRRQRDTLIHLFPAQPDHSKERS